MAITWDLFKLVHLKDPYQYWHLVATEACVVGRQVEHILLECFLVRSNFESFNVFDSFITSNELGCEPSFPKEKLLFWNKLYCKYTCIRRMVILQIRKIWRITIRQIKENCKRQNCQSADYTQTNGNANRACQEAQNILECRQQTLGSGQCTETVCN